LLLPAPRPPLLPYTTLFRSDSRGFSVIWDEVVPPQNFVQRGGVAHGFLTKIEARGVQSENRHLAAEGQQVCIRNCAAAMGAQARSEEHTSELQSRFDLVCRL